MLNAKTIKQNGEISKIGVFLFFQLGLDSF